MRPRSTEFHEEPKKRVSVIMEIVKVSGEDDIAEVAALARKIWTAHYTPIIGKAQVDYMLERFQSEQAIAQQIRDGQEYYLLRDEGEVGYLGLVPDSAQKTLMISKIYVDGEQRGKGYGWHMLDFVESLCRERGLESIWLTVNKHNQDSIYWYQNRGFNKTGALVQDIGGGFVMDDYRLEKSL
ncbi:ribosomal protein S18 acetylase RimI-like enzyme [Natronospira proteinivora]|uniref:Ribosomal protein S18 acetylase RimI-like enzyme n=1 Tax=Natronospira proteinivora TaxID=1807133 RepID=A0ABT1GA19_9GAMM|nr:GNAT family N-acetyltransferase [Natronospira proteinivora]MCP1726787.1 ribosomal protein S18 acetylase RimI-like enzyme [Natronospira proteinivora]